MARLLMKLLCFIMTLVMILLTMFSAIVFAGQFLSPPTPDFDPSVKTGVVFLLVMCVAFVLSFLGMEKCSLMSSVDPPEDPRAPPL